MVICFHDTKRPNEKARKQISSQSHADYPRLLTQTDLDNDEGAAKFIESQRHGSCRLCLTGSPDHMPTPPHNRCISHFKVFQQALCNLSTQITEVSKTLNYSSSKRSALRLNLEGVLPARAVDRVTIYCQKWRYKPLWPLEMPFVMKVDAQEIHSCRKIAREALQLA